MPYEFSRAALDIDGMGTKHSSANLSINDRNDPNFRLVLSVPTSELIHVTSRFWEFWRSSIRRIVLKKSL